MGKRSDVFHTTNYFSNDNTVVHRLLANILKRARTKLSEKVRELSLSLGLPVVTATGNQTAVNQLEVSMNPSPADTALQELATEVEALPSVVDSTVALLDKLADMIRQDADNPQAMRDLATKLGAQKTKLSEAVARHTASEGDGGSPPTPPQGTTQRKHP